MTNNDVTLVMPRQAGGEIKEFDPADLWDTPTDSTEPLVPDGRARALSALAWVLPTLTMGVLGFIRLERPGLWADEFATWGFAVTPWSEFMPLLRDFDAVIGPYYALMRAWAQLVGDSDFALRTPSVIFVAGAAGLVAQLGTRVGGPRAGLVAGMMFAVLPATTRYAQEARPYALAMFAAALSTWLLVRALDRPSFARLLPYALALWLLGLAHAVALVLVIAHGVVVLAVRRRAMLGWMTAATIGAIPGGSLLYIGMSQKNQISWIPLASFERMAAVPEEVFGGTLIGGVVIALALMGLSLDRQMALITTWATLPIALLFVVGHFTPIFLHRYLLFAMPAWVILAAVALARSLIMRALVALGVVAMLAFPTHSELRKADGHGQDPRALAGTLAALTTPGDGVIFGPNASGEGRVGRDLVAHYVPEDRRPADVLVERPPRTGGHIMPSECLDIATCLSSVERLWIIRTVSTGDPLVDIGAEKRRIVSELYDINEVWRYRGLTLALAIRKPADAPAMTG